MPPIITPGGAAFPTTTKGDIFTFGTSATRLPVGTNGQHIEANSAETTGLAYTSVLSLPHQTSHPATPSGKAVLYAMDSSGIDANTKCYLPAGGLNGAIEDSITDMSFYGHAFTQSGGVLVDNTTYKFSSGAYKFDGIDSYLAAGISSHWTFGTGDFTLRCWVRFDSIKKCMLLAGEYYSWSGKWGFYCEADGSLRFGRLGVDEVATAAGVVTTGVWYDVICYRSSGIINIYVNNVSKLSTAYTSNLSSNDGLWIGFAGESNYCINGWMEGIEVSNVARSPLSPTAAYRAEGVYAKTSDGIVHYLGQGLRL